MCIFFGTTVEERQCNERRFVNIVGEESGYLMSINRSRALLNQIGLNNNDNSYNDIVCRYLIQTHRGQQINLTVFDFMTLQRGGGSAAVAAVTSSSDTTCRPLAIVLEPPKTDAVASVCWGETGQQLLQQRVRHVYLSVGHRLQLELIDRENDEGQEQPRFLIQFQG